MSKFFAILRDSFREAVDGFVIYVMLVLSGVVILLVGSLSFDPLPPARRSPRSPGLPDGRLPEKGGSQA